MKDYLLQLKTQVIELWQKMTKTQKIIIGCSAVLLFGTLILLARGATKPDYGPLFTQMDDQQTGQIVAKLEEKKIPYILSEEGSGLNTILVPTKDIVQTRVELASEGMPTGGVVGFETFDNTKFGETDTDRRARYLRALQGELTRTIEGMAEVEKARVHIVQPEPSVFIEEQGNATAAVMLKLKPNKTLEPSQVKGLVMLVTNSVEGLKPENVTVVDTAGNILSEDIPTDKSSLDKKLTMDQIELQKQLQKDVQNSVQSMLERIVGIGKAVVRVQLELDFDKIQSKTQEFGEKVPRSTERSEKTVNTTTSETPGAPGTDTNIPGYETVGQTGTSESTELHEIINNEINTYEEVRERAPGSIRRLSVAVVIDKEIDDQQLRTIEDIVKGATGFNAERGDQISVAGMPFNTEYQDKMQSEMAAAEKQRQMMLYAGLAALALLLIGGVVAFVIIRRRRSAAEEPIIEEEEVIPVPIMEVEEEEEVAPLIEEPTPEEKERQLKRDRVEKVARENPDDIAQLLRTWLAEE